jgi:nucleotide-binding universal stress UspA family protein
MLESLRKILVPTDGSPASESAFPAIMPLVRAYRPEVDLLYVFENPEQAYLPPPELPKACGALRSAGVNACLELAEGKPAQEILRVAREKNADLIAMSTHGRSGLVRLTAGSIAEEVLRKSDIPLLITRPGTMVQDWKTLAVALDGSDQAEAVLPEVIGLARSLHATVVLIQVVFPVIAGGVGETAIVLPPEDPRPYLNGVAARLAVQGVTARIVALDGPPAGELLRHLEASPSSLLCMTTHGRSGLARLFLGSVAEEVLRKAPCPVLLRRVVPASGAPRESSKQGIVVI